VAPELKNQEVQKIRAFISHMARVLEQEGVAYDIESHQEAPPGLRLWCGATVETEDLNRLFPWLEWAFKQARRHVVQNYTEAV
jgi:phosphoserine aminotransferase